MQAKVIGVLRSFNMFDPSFKNLQFIQDYIGLELAMQVVKYDQKVLMPFAVDCLQGFDINCYDYS